MRPSSSTGRTTTPPVADDLPDGRSARRQPDGIDLEIHDHAAVDLLPPDQVGLGICGFGSLAASLAALVGHGRIPPVSQPENKPRT